MCQSKQQPLLRLALAAAFGVFMLFGSQIASAQNAQGTILGHIVDPSGAAVTGAKVTITNQNTNVQSNYVTNATGDYTVPQLNPGPYTITVQSPGFQTASSSNLTLEVQQTLRQNFKLTVGNVSTTVAVSASTQMLHTSDATVGQVIQGKLMEALPMNGRDFTNLMLTNIGTNITPGGSGPDWSYHGLNTEYMEVSADGAQAQSTSYSVDGIYDADYFFSVPINIPNESAIQEFKMMNGMYGAEYGPGVAQVNVAIKSGTNQLHGQLYETFQNNVLQPDNQYVAAQNRITGSHTPLSTPYSQNQFGGAAGGPLTLPFLYNGKDRTFWFVSYDGGRYNSTNSPSSVLSPSTAELSGDFSAWPYPIYNPQTTVPNPAYNSGLPLSPTNSPIIRTPFPGNKIPTTQIDPVAAKMATYFNTPNNPNCTDTQSITSGCYDYSANTETTKRTDVETVRFDQYFGQGDHVFLTGNMGNLSQESSSISFGQGGTTYERPKLFGGTWSHVFSPNTLNQATLGYSRDHFLTGPSTAYGPNLSALVGFANSVPNPATYDLPGTCLFNYYCIGGGEPTTYVDNIYQGVDTVTLVRGRHNMDFGIDARRIQLFELDNYLGTGSLNFNGQYTSLVPGFAGQAWSSNGVVNPNLPYAGNAAADFVLGDPNSASGPPPLGTDDYILWGVNWNLYFQDNIHATNHLTLNAGLRWERPPNFHSKDASGYAFNPNNGGQLVWANCAFPTSILAAGGSPQYLGCGASNTLVPIDNKDFAPRVGFSYNPSFLNSKFVLRGGFGIFYGLYNRYYDGTQFDKNSIYNKAAAPYSNTTGQETQSTAVLKNLWSPPITADQSFSLPSYLFPYNQVNWPTNHNPYDYQWSLDTEYSLRESLMLDVGYVGDAGRRQPSQDIVGAGTPPTVAGDTCNSLADISQATGGNAGCLSDPNFQPIDTRTPFKNMPPYFYANINGFSSSYNALQVQLIQRPWHGLVYHLNYTYSKTMDLTSGINLVFGEPSLIQNPHNPYKEYGLSASDQTNRFVATYAYQVPDHLIHKKGLDLLSSGWTASGVYQLASGFPFAIYGNPSADQMGEYYGGRFLANSTFQTTPGFKSTLRKFFDTSKYSTPELGRYGNTNKSPERGPYFTNLDASFGKTTNLGGQRVLITRAEFFNLGSTWHANPGQLFPDSTVTDTNFGSLINPTYGNVSLWNPRILQLTAQFNF
ncbi:MAG: carboxypeptidase-like regulatory domain-containing protein [Acidobacteriaceae bacterium]